MKQGDLLIDVSNKVSAVLAKIDSLITRIEMLEESHERLEKRQGKIERYINKLIGGVGVALFLVSLFKDQVLGVFK